MPDLPARETAPQAAHWVPSGKSVGGMSSGLSHLHADIYELENSSARCGRLLVRGIAMVFDRYLRADRERARYSRVI